MPTYDYKCEACEHTFEKYLPMDDRNFPEIEPCPKCGAMKVKRAFVGMPGFSDPASLGIKQPDGEFKDLMKQIKKKNRGRGNIDRYT